MKNYFKLAVIAFLTITFFSCEEVIELPLNNADQKIVVEAFTSNIEGRSFIKLTKTSNVYTTNNLKLYQKLQLLLLTVTEITLCLRKMIL